VNFWSLLEATNYSKKDEEDEDSVPPSWNNLSEVLHFVLNYVRENTPGWFDEHINRFREQTDGLFSIEYTEEEFAKRLYDAPGFLGGNFRYRKYKSKLDLYGIRGLIPKKVPRWKFTLVLY
jgi:hypothetical protein